MKKLTSATVLLVLLPMGMFGQPSVNRQESLPVPPDVEQGASWLAYASREYQEGQAIFPRMERSLPEFVEASDDGWNKLKVLRVGEKVRVVSANFTKIKGQFLRATDGAISFQAKKNGHKEEVTVPRHEVRMVSIPHSRAKPILLLLLAGALMGASAMRGPDHDDCYCGWDSDRREPPSGKEVAIAAGIGAAAMGLLGAFSEPGDELVYLHNPRAELSEVPIDAALVPPDAMQSEGGNVFAPVGARGDGERQADKTPRDAR